LYAFSSSSSIFACFREGGLGIGKEVASQGLQDMRKLYGLGRNLWQKQVHRWLLAAILGALVGVAAGRTVIASVSGSVSVVDGVSMAPTYQPGAYVYTGPITTPIQRGDVVLIDDGLEARALKRVVGLPGETVHLWRGGVFINRKLLCEPYLPRFTYTSPDERTETYVFRLGDAEYFVLGDNRSSSLDSRVYGPVEQTRLKSRVPMPENMLRPTFTPYMLPAAGKRAIQPAALVAGGGNGEGEVEALEGLKR
jgi:signal peptidase I